MLIDPKSVKRYWQLDWILTLLGATHIKALRKFVGEIDTRRQNKFKFSGWQEPSRRSSYLAQMVSRRRKCRQWNVDKSYCWRIKKYRCLDIRRNLRSHLSASNCRTNFCYMSKTVSNSFDADHPHPFRRWKLSHFLRFRYVCKVMGCKPMTLRWQLVLGKFYEMIDKELAWMLNISWSKKYTL